MAKRLEGKRVVLLVANEFEDIELWYPALRLSEEGAEVVICAGEENYQLCCSDRRFGQCRSRFCG